MTAQRVLDVLCTDDTGRCPSGPLPALTDVLDTEGYTAFGRIAPVGRNVMLSGLTSRLTREAAKTGNGAYRCIRPIEREIRAGEDTPLGSSYLIEVRCRKCEPCQKAKSAFWKLRAMREIELAPRTWFVTLTFTADQQYRAEAGARLRLAKSGVKNPTPKEIFGGTASILLTDVTKWLKRVRKGRKDQNRPTVQFRYLLVVEAHEGGGTLHGFPHCHLLIHEIAAGSITKRRLQESWLCGFSSAKLVGEASLDPHKAAAYTAKYISKSALARVRASRAYGVD